MKKRIFAILAAAIIAVMLIVPSFADEVGETPYTTATSLQSYFGQSYNGNIGNDNTYTLCIDVIALAQAYIQEGAETVQSSCGLNADIESKSDILNIAVEFYNTNTLANTAISIMIDEEEIVTLTLGEVQNAGGNNEELYVLIPFEVWDAPSIMDTGWSSPNPPYQIFNNIQLSNTRTYRAGYETGHSIGYEDGYGAGYDAGYNAGNEEHDIAEAGIRAVTAAVETPFNVISQWLNFEVLGVNMLSLLISLFAVCILVIVIKAIIK